MKPQLIITTISESRSNISLPKLDGIQFSSAELHFDYEISVVGVGDFTDYLTGDKKFDYSKLMMDILLGKITISGVVER
jgi:hypothetical protein